MSWFGICFILFPLISLQEKKKHTPVQQLRECSVSPCSQRAQIWAHPFPRLLWAHSLGFKVKILVNAKQCCFT